MSIEPKEYRAEEMCELYKLFPEIWLLLEILETNESGRAERLLLLKADKDKEILNDFLMDEVEDWDWDKKFIFVYSDPNKECIL